MLLYVGYGVETDGGNDVTESTFPSMRVRP
jgi:hypothetical protein